MVLGREIIEVDNSTAEDILQLMKSSGASPAEKAHGWGKMIIHPEYDESFLSWLMRQAWAFGITPKRLIQSEKEYWRSKENIFLDLPQEQFLTLDVSPVSATWENVLLQRGLNVGINELRLDISKWFDITKEPKARKLKLQNYYHYSLRYCPLCWKDKDNRYFKRVWRLPFVIVCPEHGTELKASCPSCGELLFADRYINPGVVLGNFQKEWLVKCRHCSHLIAEEAIEKSTELARLQKNVLNTLLSDSYWATPRGYLIFWHKFLVKIRKQKLAHAETCLKFMETILEKPISIQHGNYSQELTVEIENRLQDATLYLSGVPSKDLKKFFGLTNFSSVKKFTSYLLCGMTLDDVVKMHLGYMGKFGLELAQAELRALKTKYGRIPKYEDGIMGAIKRREWIYFGIETWNDLLRKTFGDTNIEMGIYTGKEGLKRAIAELKDYKIKHNKLPENNTKRWVLIRRAVNCCEWISFGIGTWMTCLLQLIKMESISDKRKNACHPYFQKEKLLVMHIFKRVACKFQSRLNSKHPFAGYFTSKLWVQLALVQTYGFRV